MVKREHLIEAIGLLSSILKSPTAVTTLSEKWDQRQQEFSFNTTVDGEMQRLLRVCSGPTWSARCCTKFCLPVKNGMHLAEARTAAVKPDRHHSDF